MQDSVELLSLGLPCRDTRQASAGYAVTTDCVALQMLMVLFDILVSHRRMSRWHEKRIQVHLKEQQVTQQAKSDLQRRLNSNAEASTSQPSPHQALNGQHAEAQPFRRQTDSSKASSNHTSSHESVAQQVEPSLQHGDHPPGTAPSNVSGARLLWDVSDACDMMLC